VPKLQPLAAKESKKISPKRRPGGITGRSIARYALNELGPVEDTTKASPHFAPVFNKPTRPDVAELEKQSDQADKPKKPRKPRKSKGKDESMGKEPRKKVASKPKTVAFIVPKLLSPKQHAGKLKRQEILFGTSSQLIQDDSPRFTREMQQVSHDSLVDDDELEDGYSSPIPLRHTEAVRRSRGKLWAESAHADVDADWHRISDFEQPTVNLETQSMKQNHIYLEQASTDATETVVDTTLLRPTKADAETGLRESSPVASNGFWLTENSATLPVTSNGMGLSLATAVTISSSPRPSTSPARTALRPLSTNTKSPRKQQPIGIDVGLRKATTNNESDMTTKESTASPTKRPRGRPRKEDIHSEQPPSPVKQRGRPRRIVASSPSSLTPKKRRKPPKVATSLAMGLAIDADAGFQHIDDIEDSEVDDTPSTPRRRGAASSSPQLPLTTSTKESEPTGKRANTTILNDQHPRWPKVKAKLFQEITSIVKSAPPTGDIRKPSWHEKMLLYDPIVLEDLTAWLNEQGLKVEGKDSASVDISCWMVQSWCENNSICCLWKEGLRGGVRTRY
jgi:hypothetical protein